MEMEVDEGHPPPQKPQGQNQDQTDSPSVVSGTGINVWYSLKKQGLKRTKLPVDLAQINLESLKEALLKDIASWEWKNETDKPNDVDILYNSRLVKSDEDVKKIKPFTVVTVIGKVKPPEPKPENFAVDYAKSRHIHEQLTQVALALRTAFFNPNFVPMIEKLGDSEMLENIFAIATELKNDPVGIAIIQDPAMIYHLSDPDSLKKIANTKPWVIEAFNFIAASIHQEKGPSQPQGIPSHLFNAAMFDGDDEMEEDDDEQGAAGGGAGGAGPRGITREQLAAALGSLNALGGGSGGGLSPSSPFAGLFQNRPASSTAPQSGSSSTSRTPSAPPNAGANIQNLMNTLAGAGGGVPGQPLNSDVVARAVTEALRRLTPEQRADQMNAIRNFATQLTQPGSSAPAAANPPTAPAQAPQQPPPPTSAGAQQYAEQLRQMREMGITNERLSILALQVSDGDVNTAADLIFSGWQGEGSEPME